MKVMIFEGTAEELKPYIPQITTAGQFSAILSADKAPEGSEPVKEEKTHRKPVCRKWHPCIAETADGGIKKYKSAKHAFRWYQQASGEDREHWIYTTFYAALKKDPVTFADASITMITGGVA